MERKKRARELGISEEELARQEGEEIDDEEDEESIATSDMLKDLQVGVMQILTCWPGRWGIIDKRFCC